jgi:hypothetical protein
MNICRFCITLTFLLFCLYCNAFSQGGAPMVTDDAATVEKDHMETNLGFTLEHNETAHIYELPLIDFNYGLTPHLQVKIEIPFVINHELGDEAVRGMGKLSFGLKWKFLDHEEHISAGVYPQIYLNITSTASQKGLTDEGIEFFLPLSVEKGFKKNAFVVQVGRFFKTTQSGEWFYGMLLNHELTKQFEFAGEFFGYLPSNFSDNETFLNFGVRVKMYEHLRFLFSAGRSIIKSHEGSTTVIAYLGVQITL